MAHNVQLAREIGSQPWYVETNDGTTRTWLETLNTATDSLDSETASALWAAKLSTGKYVVSAEAYKRVQARNF